MIPVYIRRDTRSRKGPLRWSDAKHGSRRRKQRPDPWRFWALMLGLIMVNLFLCQLLGGFQ